MTERLHFHFSLSCESLKVKLLNPVQLCGTMDCSLPGSSVHEIFQARVLEWVAISFPGDLPHPGIKPGSLAFQADALPSEPPGNSLFIIVPVYLPKFSPNYLFTPK